MKKIVEVKVMKKYQLKLKFADGVEGTVDLSNLVGKGVFSFWDNYDSFKKVKIGSAGELVWDNHVDLCPDSLYLKITGQLPEDLFPKLKEKAAYA